MISEFHITNFKSLMEFELHVPKFCVLVGMNGAGKSTILQAFDFLGQLMRGDIDGWLENRGWEAADLGSRLASASNILAGVGQPADGGKLAWAAAFNRKERACLSELVETAQPDASITEQFRVKDRQYRVDAGASQPWDSAWQGSLLSQLPDAGLPADVLALRDNLRRIHSLEQLSPHLMRRRIPGAGNGADIGAGGEHLAAFLHAVKGQRKLDLLAALRGFYPQVADIRTAPTREGWTRLSIVEDVNGRHVESDARHAGDGMLRILAMLAQTMGGDATLLFDEVENGINPEMIERLVDVLAGADQQIVVTTNGPMFLNYLEDDVARASVIFVYKTPDGVTRARPFFDIPGIGEKLESMGPGEAYIHTDLAELTAQCVTLDLAEQPPAQ